MKQLAHTLRHTLLTGAIGASLALGLSVPAFAESPVKESEIVITATKTQRDLSEISSSLSVVTQEEITRHGYTSIADILQDVPGVEVFDQSLAGSKRINIRGESGSRVLILVDGQKITEQKSMDGAPLLIDPSDIERIEVIKGPASVLYGSEAIGGAINIITKKGGDKPIQGSASAVYNSSTEGFKENLSVYGGVGKFSYRLSGSHSDQGDRETPHGKLEESDSKSTIINAWAGYETEKIAMGLKVEDFDSEVDSPSSTVDGNYFNLNLPEWSRRKASATMDLKKVSALIPKVHLDAFTQKTQKDFEQNMKINMGMMGTVSQDIKTFNDQQTSGTNLQIDITPNSRHYLIAGYSFTHDDLEADSSVKMPPMVNKVYTDEATIDTHALFVQDEWKLPQDLMLTLGARQTWVESELEESNRTGANEGSVNDNEPVFSGGITWNGVENLTLRGHFAQGYRFPDLSKLFIGTSHGGSTTNANPDLKPETSNNYELGARYNNGFWNIDFTAFYNDAEDYITRKATGSNVYQFTNVSKAETKGVELALKYKIDALKLTPYFSGTWMEREFKSPKRTTKKTGTPKFSGRLGIKYETPLTRWPALVWTDFWLRAASDSDSYDTSDKLIAKESWETLNFSMGAEFGTKGQYQVSLNLNNILDESYKTARNTLEEPGFHAVARLGVKF